MGGAIDGKGLAGCCKPLLFCPFGAVRVALGFRGADRAATPEGYLAVIWV